MTMTESRPLHAYLCIGGPYDGRRYAADELGFKVAHQTKLAPVKPFGQMDLAAPVEVNYTTYVADYIRHRTGELWFWRPADQSLNDTLAKLIACYEQANNIVWSEIPERFR